MALFAKEVRAPQKESQAISEKEQNALSTEEIAFLLELLKKSTFVGEHVETVYNTALKLQNQYLEQSKK